MALFKDPIVRPPDRERARRLTDVEFWDYRWRAERNGFSATQEIRRALMERYGGYPDEIRDRLREKDVECAVACARAAWRAALRLLQVEEPPADSTWRPASRSEWEGGDAA